MAVVTKTVTTYTCDRCGYESRKPMERQGNLELTMKETVVMFGGDVGGATTQVWLCGLCLEDHRKFMNNEDAVGRTNA
jgi:hypothetical protein